MKKANVLKIALCVLVVVLVLGCFFACNKKTCTVTLMDGDTVIDTLEVEPGSTLSLVAPTKDGATFEQWYKDAEFQSLFDVNSDVVDEDITLYAKFNQRALSIMVNSNGGTDVDRISVTTGAQYTVPAPIKEGYRFTGYTYHDENGTEHAFPQSGSYGLRTNVLLTAQWEILSFTVNFKNADESIIDTQIVQYNQKASAITVKGYSISGLYTNKEFSGEKFTLGSFPIKDNTDIYVDKIAITYHITVLGWNDLSCDVDYDSTYTLLNPEDTSNALFVEKVGTTMDHEWSSFTGYTLDGEAFSFTGKYTWDKNITVIPTHVENANYNKCTVTFLNTVTNATVTEVKVNKGATVATGDIPSTSARGYGFNGWFTSDAYTDNTAFSAETVVNNSITIYSKFTPNSYVITCDNVNYPVTFGQTYNLPIDKFGFTFGGYTLNGDNFPATGTYNIDGNITVVGTWTGVDTVANNYFMDNGVYVFLKGFTYNFKSADISSAATSNGTISIFTQDGDNKFEAKKLSDGFVLNVGENELSCKIVDYIRSIGFGADFNNMLAAGNNGTVYQKTVVAADYVMDVGVTEFKPDIVIKDDNLESIDLATACVDLLITENGTPVANVEYSVYGDSISFDSSCVGRTFTLEFAPKYALPSQNLTNPTLTVKLNNGVNVYTSLELRNNYANLAVHKINVLRNIKAELLDTDYEAGHGRQIGNITLDVNGNTEVMENVDLGRPKNNFGKGVYARSSVAGSNDSIVVNGNYFTIDGSKLPYVYDTNRRTSGMGYAMSNTQIGIFLYRSVRTDEGTSPETTYDDQTYRSNDGHATISNLRISGNNLYSSLATQSGIDELPFLKMSSAYIGMVVRGGTVSLDNVAIVNVGMGVMVHGGVSGFFEPGINATYGGVIGQVQAVDEVAAIFSMTDCSIKNAWCNDIYVFDLAEINLIGTQLNGCSGAAIHFDNRPYGGTQTDSLGYTNCNSSLNMDIYTASHINNWVAGTEPWFVAYDKTSAASQIKVGFEEALNPNGLTIIKNMLGAEMMNLAIVVNPCDPGAVAAWLMDDDGTTHADQAGQAADIKRHMSTININVLSQAEAVGLKVFYDATVDGAELVEFGTQYATLAASDPTLAQQYAFGKFLSYGAMASDGSSGMGIYLPVMIKQP